VKGPAFKKEFKMKKLLIVVMILCSMRAIQAVVTIADQAKRDIEEATDKVLKERETQRERTAKKIAQPSVHLLPIQTQVKQCTVDSDCPSIGGKCGCSQICQNKKCAKHVCDACAVESLGPVGVVAPTPQTKK
jgi:hypothetical protein